MTSLIEVTEYRVTLGVFGDNDVEPTLFLGRVEGSWHLEELLRDMLVVAEDACGIGRRGDHFWQCESSVLS